MAFFTKYRFSRGHFYGLNDGIQLSNLQIGHSQQYEGILFEGYSPKDCITIAVVQENYGQLCLNHIKMELNDIIIIDDTKPYDFVSSHRAKLGIISIRKSLLIEKIPAILELKNRRLKERDNLLSNTIETVWREVCEEKDIGTNQEKLNAIEERVIKSVIQVIKDNTTQQTVLTQGEKTSIQIKCFLLHSLEESLSISQIAKKFDISEKTFQNSFKSLYGMTPKYFLQMVKLNKAHEDLLLTHKSKMSVSEIATKWDFNHFGRFSKYLNSRSKCNP